MATLTVSMARRTITATISGLEEEHDSGRTFHWWLDGELVKTERIKDALTSRVYTYTAVKYSAMHTVRVQINSYDDDEEFASLTASVSDTMALWSWDISNGSATAAQTWAAYIAATTQGQTADFSRLVWNDLVEALASTIPSWQPGYAALDDVLMAAPYDNLTADRFNAVVQNIGYPWMFWASKPGRKGYIGRLAVKGYKQSGAAADIVYGQYLVELAYMLNVLIDAEGEFNAGYARRMGHTNLSGLYTSANLPLRAPPSRHLGLYDELWMSDRQILTAPPSQHLERVGSIWTVPDITFGTDESRHLAIRDPLRIIRDLTLVASNERPMYIDWILGPITDILLKPAVSRAMGVLARPKTTSSIEIGLGDSLPLSAVIRFVANETITLLANGSTELAADINEISTILAELNPRASSILDIIARSYSTSNILLIPTDTAQLLHDGSALLSDILTFTAPDGKHMTHRGDIDFLIQMADMSASVGTKMSHQSRVGGGTLFFANMANPPSARMAHAAAKAIATLLVAEMNAPTSAHMVHRGGLSLRALFFAEMNVPASVWMAFDAKSKIALAGIHDLFVPPSVWFSANVNSRLGIAGDFDFSDSLSVHISADVEEAVQDAVDADLSARPSAKLSGLAQNSTSGTDGTLAPTPPQPIVHDGSVMNASGDAELAPRESVSHAMNGIHVTAFSAEIGFLEIPSFDWVTQDGTNLYIRGIWSGWIDGEHLHFGDVIFYEPIRTGTNLYIRTVWNGWPFDKNLHIGNLVYYDPVHDGSDLYIRSVNKIWLDGSEANVDKQFFLEPVRTGSNLHIRQDVFGG